jgi:CRP-like cAMP-binding protein
MNNDELQRVAEFLKGSPMFQHCSNESLLKLASSMTRVEYRKGAIILPQGYLQKNMYLVLEGEVRREREDNSQIHYLDETIGEHGHVTNVYGALHVLNENPSYASLVCVSDSLIYEVSSEKLRSVIQLTKPIQLEIVSGLTQEIRRQSRLQRTPLLEQHAKPTPVIATSLAASMESFFRSALNSLLNYRLTGQAPSTWFPNMHIQIPTRVVLINGFKGLRAFFEDKVKPENYGKYETHVRILAASAPGLIMCPFSSLLEACNATHMNPEPLYRRWTRGFIPRGVREIIFGVGLNQLSDYCEERIVQDISNPALRNAAGSLLAGVISGYISHVPHNLSTLKLLTPQQSYGHHFTSLYTTREQTIPGFVTKPATRKLAAIALTILTPKGVVIRTSQIVGSFIILNGTINYLLYHR